MAKVVDNIKEKYKIFSPAGFMRSKETNRNFQDLEKNGSPAHVNVVRPVCSYC